MSMVLLLILLLYHSIVVHPSNSICSSMYFIVTLHTISTLNLKDLRRRVDVEWKSRKEPQFYGQSIKSNNPNQLVRTFVYIFSSPHQYNNFAEEGSKKVAPQAEEGKKKQYPLYKFYFYRLSRV